MSCVEEDCEKEFNMMCQSCLNSIYYCNQHGISHNESFSHEMTTLNLEKKRILL